MSFTPRKSAPSTTDKNWIHTSKGGRNECILITGNSCIPNCVGYAWGRWYEILGSRPKLSRANAENWYGYTADGYKRSKEPSLGAVVCWAKGKVGDGSDGAGHVAIVEEIKSNGDIVTSNSGYKTNRFWTQTFTKASGYNMKGYTFQGFIHLPNATPITTPTNPSASSEVTTVTPYRVRVTVTDLRIREGHGTDTKIVSSYIEPGVYTIVEEANGPGASKWGHLKSKVGWISLDFVTKL
ncbi:MAG: CHAP domain-containing protein [Lachnospiraceae bacterium]|nr:CHAP domain-containing protein [Lachnospiraceae bacterium]